MHAPSARNHARFSRIDHPELEHLVAQRVAADLQQGSRVLEIVLRGAENEPIQFFDMTLLGCLRSGAIIL